MSTKGEVRHVQCLRFERVLPGSIENVWRHLVDTALLPSWFGKASNIEPRQGGRVRLMSGHIRGTVTQWQPPKKVIYTWNVFEPDDPEDAVSAYPESYPTFELETHDDGVLLTFLHFPIPERFVSQSAMGWHTMMDILGATLRGEEVADRSVYSRRNATLYGVDLENLER